MPIFQLCLSILGVIVVPALVYYIGSQIDKRMGALELSLEKRFGEISQINSRHVAESETTHQNFERRLTMLESREESIQARFSQIQINIADALRECGAMRPRKESH